MTQNQAKLLSAGYLTVERADILSSQPSFFTPNILFLLCHSHFVPPAIIFYFSCCSQHKSKFFETFRYSNKPICQLSLKLRISLLTN